MNQHFNMMQVTILIGCRPRTRHLHYAQIQIWQTIEPNIMRTLAHCKTNVFKEKYFSNAHIMSIN